MRRTPFDPKRPRVIVLGFDGLSPRLMEPWMEAGLLPNFARLAREGTYRRLQTTVPSESPIAWSSFATGCNPGKHGIFGFLHRAPETYLAEPSYLRLGRRIGRRTVPLPQRGRQGQSFWQVAGEHGISTTVMRAPLSFPFERVKGGLLLSGLGTPGLLGSAGGFTAYRTNLQGEHEPAVMGGDWVTVRVENDRVETELLALQMPARGITKTVPLRFLVDRAGQCVTIELSGQRQTVGVGQWSDWFEVAVPLFGPLIRLRGTCRFYVVSVEPELWVHATALNFHPASLVPLSSPFGFARMLARELGLFATLGIPEEVGGLIDGDLPEDVYLADMYDGWRQQEAMDEFVMARYPANLFVALHLQTDVLQHGFWRFTDETHPLYDPITAEKYRDAILTGYRYADGVLGRMLAKHVDEQTTVLVLSDHGFESFRRNVNLNTWLAQNDFLSAKPPIRQDAGAARRFFFRHVHWGRTKAYGLGLGTLYLNLLGREGKGIVAAGEEAQQVKQAIRHGLKALVDPRTGVHPIAEVYDAAELYHGPHVGRGPDLVVTLEPGYRISWPSMLGVIEPEIFSDNLKKWSGDHVNLPADRSHGIFFANRPLAAEAPSIMDLGPTALSLLGVPVPAEMDGKSLI
ncbi:MAG: alkaline phosphatase family protein [Chloroflexi bacterium]|nr:alkaline phosphatase family protein [Chloroflexota bacterium]